MVSICPHEVAIDMAEDEMLLSTVLTTDNTVVWRLYAALLCRSQEMQMWCSGKSAACFEFKPVYEGYALSLTMQKTFYAAVVMPR